MKIKIIALLLFISTSISFSQTILSSGSIYEGEFTPDKKISGLFTYMNNSDVSLKLEVERKTDSGNQIVISRDVAPQRGRQLRVYEQEFSSTDEQVYGVYTISFYLVENGVKNDLVFQYSNVNNFAPFLRVVSVFFSGLNEDNLGRYFDVKIDWQTINAGTQTDNRKCYLFQ